MTTHPRYLAPHAMRATPKKRTKGLYSRYLKRNGVKKRLFKGHRP